MPASLFRRTSFSESSHPPVQISFSYLADIERYRVERPYATEFKVDLESEEHRTDVEFKPKILPLTNIKGIEQKISIEEHGFEVLQVPQLVVEMYFSKNEQHENMDGVAKLTKERFNTDHVFCHTHRVGVQSFAEDSHRITKHETPSRRDAYQDS